MADNKNNSDQEDSHEESSADAKPGKDEKKNTPKKEVGRRDFLSTFGAASFGFFALTNPLAGGRKDKRDFSPDDIIDKLTENAGSGAPYDAIEACPSTFSVEQCIETGAFTEGGRCEGPLFECTSGFGCEGGWWDDFECTSTFVCAPTFVCTYSFDSEDCEGIFKCQRYEPDAGTGFGCDEGFSGCGTNYYVI